MGWSPRIFAVAIAALLMSSCAGPTTVPEGLAPPTESTPWPVESVESVESVGPEVLSPEPEDDPPTRETFEPVTCEGADTIAVSFSLVESALGHRYVFLTVRNCAPEAIQLPAEPLFTGVDEDGTEDPDAWEWRERQGSLTLAPNADKIIVAHWLSNGRCERGVDEMRLHLLGQTFSERDCYQFGGGMAPDRDGAAGDLYWADDPSKGPGWQPEDES